MRIRKIGRFCLYLTSTFFLASLFFLNDLLSNRFFAKRNGIEQNKYSQNVLVLDLDLHENRNALLTRSTFYEIEIQRAHLYRGMIVNRDLRGKVRSECDSLLFSSLRYISLKMLDFDATAEEAWQNLKQAFRGGSWYRHPNCRRRSTSRDMVLGVLAAYTVRGELDQDWQEFIAKTGENRGFIGTGSPDVSLLTPGLASIIKMLDPSALDKLPLPYQKVVSTIEVESLYLQKGYRAHLFALRLWLEHRLTKSRPKVSLFAGLDLIFNTDEEDYFLKQRLSFAASNLYHLDPDNLFFEWLYLEISESLSPEHKLRLMRKLNSMPQFPKDRLPQNCDRHADYLWQRSSDEYRPRALFETCHEQYAGVDFLWMAGLLLEQKPSGTNR